MPKAKTEKVEEKVEKKVTLPVDGFYKGYDIKWLKSVKDEHTDGHLIDEYEAEFGEVK